MVMMVGELRRAESRSEVHELHQRRPRSLTGFTESRGEDSGHLVCRGAVWLALSPVLPANVYPVLVEVPPDGVHDGFVVRPCGLQPDVLEAVVYVPQGNPVAATEQKPGFRRR